VKRFIFIGVIVAMVFLFLFVTQGLAFAYSSSEKDFSENSGPIAIRNQMPLYLFYLQMVPDKAEVLAQNKFRINADYTVSSISVSAFTPVTSLYDIEIDLEVSRINIDLRYGVYDNLEIGMELAYISLSSGYLDDFIEAVEDGIGARTPRSRQRQGSYEFDYSFRYNGKDLIREKHSMEGLGDMALSAKYQLLKEEKDRFIPNISVRSAVKFPTAKKDDLLGSGEVDYGVGLLLDKGFFDRLFIYVGGNVVMIEKPNFLDDISLEDKIYSGMLAMEYFFTRRFSFVAQVSGNTTPYPSSDTTALDNDAYELGLGVNYAAEKENSVSWHFALVENIKTASSPDVSFRTGLNWKF